MITPPLVAEVGNCRQKDHGEEEEQNSYETSVSVTASLLCEYWAKKKKGALCLSLDLNCMFSTEPDRKKQPALVMATEYRHPTRIIFWRNQHSMEAGEFEF